LCLSREGEATLYIFPLTNLVLNYSNKNERKR
jgi:hypothetical protein